MVHMRNEGDPEGHSLTVAAPVLVVQLQQPTECHALLALLWYLLKVLMTVPSLGPASARTTQLSPSLCTSLTGIWDVLFCEGSYVT